MIFMLSLVRRLTRTSKTKCLKLVLKHSLEANFAILRSLRMHVNNNVRRTSFVS
jgi:hypothetical protein